MRNLIHKKRNFLHNYRNSADTHWLLQRNYHRALILYFKTGCLTPPGAFYYVGIRKKRMITKIKSYQVWVQSNRLVWGLVLIVAFSLLRFVQTTTWKLWFGSTDFQESITFALFLLFWFILISIG